MPWYQNPIAFCQGILSHWASFLLARSTYSYPLMPFNANLDNQNQCTRVLKKFRSLNKKRDFFLTCLFGKWCFNHTFQLHQEFQALQFFRLLPWSSYITFLSDGHRCCCPARWWSKRCLWSSWRISTFPFPALATFCTLSKLTTQGVLLWLLVKPKVSSIISETA